MTREQRIASAKATSWVIQYSGKNIVKGYANWFAVDLMCAIQELRQLGVTIVPAREAAIKASVEVRIRERFLRKQTRLISEMAGADVEGDCSEMHLVNDLALLR